jgi:ribonuclease BN (tRNA processing enzyme)
MKLTVLGTATPYPKPGNACSGYLLQSDAPAAASPGARERPVNVWVDAGTGTLAELQRHIALDELDAVFVSHRHADHSADLLVAYYAFRFAELRPVHPIALIGPQGLDDRLAAFLGPSSVSELPRVFAFEAMSGWSERRLGPLTLSWGPVQHGVPAFGLAVEENGRRFAYSGDSAPCISLEELAENADLLLVEAGYDAPKEADPVHHSPDDAGRTATRAGAARLVLTHIAETVSGAEAASRAAVHFAGPIEVAEPGLSFTV